MKLLVRSGSGSNGNADDGNECGWSTQPSFVNMIFIAIVCLYAMIHVYYVTGNQSGNSVSRKSQPRTPKSSSACSSFPLSRKGRGGGFMNRRRPRPRIGSNSSSSSSNDDDDGMTASTGLDDDDDDDSYSATWMNEKDTQLEQRVPDSTSMERRRFLIARKGNIDKASSNLQSYLDWKKKHIINISDVIHVNPTKDRDYDLWVESCLEALQVSGEKVRNIVLPRVIRSYGKRREVQVQEQQNNDGGSSSLSSISSSTTPRYFLDRDGHRIFHIIPGLMDDRLARTSTYALATSIFIDKQLDRNDDEKVTVCLDVRAGKGWRNLHALKLVPFMKDSLELLLQLFPERLHKCIVYPLPPTFFYLWKVVAKCIDPKTRRKIVIVTGKCTMDAPPPNEQLAVQLGQQTTPRLEEHRVSCFRA